MNKPILCCLKIKSATLLIGSIDLMFHLTLLTTLLASLTQLSPLDQYYSSTISLITFSSASLSSSSSCMSLNPVTHRISSEEPLALPFVDRPTNGGGSSNSNSGGGRLRGSPLQQQQQQQQQQLQQAGNLPKDKSMAFMITIFSALITSMLIYGVLKRRPSYLMPFFSVKVFQVVMASLTTLGFYTCLPNVRMWIESHQYFPFKSTVLLVDNQTLELFVFAILLTSILIKLYEAIIVWYCYRYMVTFESFRSMSVTGTGNSSTNNGIVFADDDGSNNLAVKFGDEESIIGGPPKYDEIFKNANKHNNNNNNSNHQRTTNNTNNTNYHHHNNSSDVPTTSYVSGGGAATNRGLSDAASDSELAHIPSYSAAVRSINFPA